MATPVPAGKKVVFTDAAAAPVTPAATKDFVQEKLGLDAADIISPVSMMRLEWQSWYVFNVTDAAAAKLETLGLTEARLKISDRDGVPVEQRNYKKSAPGL